MDDEPWIIEDPNDAPPEEVVPEAAPAPAVVEEPPAPPAPEPEVVEYHPKPKLFKHWVRPKFLQYNYMYDYRKNYYDDVIDYLDRRQRGISRDVPRAQTWAERALRTYTSKPLPLSAFQSSTHDKGLACYASAGATFHRHYSKTHITKKHCTWS